MIKLKMPRSASHRLRDVLNEDLKHGESVPFSMWKEEWKAKYSTQDKTGNLKI